ncbi:histidine phosphatase family protein [Paenibacillus sp. OV219]|uniref:histidine phosphatase family protein n=1 Tax=Paenibacillus sp. OV219 TaxID=1884377 RepID=UPI0008BA24AF|nr:probable phosphoglycerate mutase [Paenibacillus sp. OV219]
MNVTKIGLIRHGITEWNIEKRVQGQSDIPLNDTGRQQARSLANRLKSEEWDYIFASDLIRAKETAEIIAQTMGLHVKTDERLREMYCGEIEGTTLDERVSRWGDEWGKLELGIEDDETIMSRGMSFIEDISTSLPGEKVLIISHGALLGVTLKKLIPHVDTEEHLKNTSITVLNLKSKWECELYNCARHLNESLN